MTTEYLDQEATHGGRVRVFGDKRGGRLTLEVEADYELVELHLSREDCVSIIAAMQSWLDSADQPNQTDQPTKEIK